MSCFPRHQTLLVEEWDPMGAVVSCLQCDETLHVDLPTLTSAYLCFEHRSGRDGPKGDLTLFIHVSMLESGNVPERRDPRRG